MSKLIRKGKGKFMEDTGVTISESEMGIYKLSNGKRVCFLDELLLSLLLKKYKKKNEDVKSQQIVK